LYNFAGPQRLRVLKNRILLKLGGIASSPLSIVELNDLDLSGVFAILIRGGGRVARMLGLGKEPVFFLRVRRKLV